MPWVREGAEGQERLLVRALRYRYSVELTFDRAFQEWKVRVDGPDALKVHDMAVDLATIFRPRVDPPAVTK